MLHMGPLKSVSERMSAINMEIHPSTQESRENPTENSTFWTEG